MGRFRVRGVVRRGIQRFFQSLDQRRQDRARTREINQLNAQFAQDPAEPTYVAPLPAQALVSAGVANDASNKDPIRTGDPLERFDARDAAFLESLEEMRQQRRREQGDANQIAANSALETANKLTEYVKQGEETLRGFGKKIGNKRQEILQGQLPFDEVQKILNSIQNEINEIGEKWGAESDSQRTEIPKEKMRDHPASISETEEFSSRGTWKTAQDRRNDALKKLEGLFGGLESVRVQIDEIVNDARRKERRRIRFEEKREALGFELHSAKERRDWAIERAVKAKEQLDSLQEEARVVRKGIGFQASPSNSSNIDSQYSDQVKATLELADLGGREKTIENIRKTWETRAKGLKGKFQKRPNLDEMEGVRSRQGIIRSDLEDPEIHRLYNQIVKVYGEAEKANQERVSSEEKTTSAAEEILAAAEGAQKELANKRTEKEQKRGITRRPQGDPALLRLPASQPKGSVFVSAPGATPPGTSTPTGRKR